MIIWIIHLGPNKSGLNNSIEGPTATYVSSNLNSFLALIFVVPDVLLYVYTSGTTGMPKAAVITCAR